MTASQQGCSERSSGPLGSERLAGLPVQCHQFRGPVVVVECQPQQGGVLPQGDESRPLQRDVRGESQAVNAGERVAVRRVGEFAGSLGIAVAGEVRATAASRAPPSGRAAD
jgi:hypothetical protein